MKASTFGFEEFETSSCKSKDMVFQSWQCFDHTLGVRSLVVGVLGEILH